MAWPTKTIASWQEFNELASTFPQVKGFKFRQVFRGQSKASWSLQPSLLRIVPTGTAAREIIGLEKHALAEFQSQAHLHLDASLLAPEFIGSAPLLQWWAIMQHHGAPTRLLDWTVSFYVAAYFAVESNWTEDGSIFMAHPFTVNETSKELIRETKKAPEELFVDPNSPEAVLFWTSKRRSQRLVAQQGHFSYCTNAVSDHERQLEMSMAKLRALDATKASFCKYVIPAKCKPEFLSRLRAMNIAANALFPGVDGLGRMIAEVMRLGQVTQEPVA